MRWCWRPWCWGWSRPRREEPREPWGIRGGGAGAGAGGAAEATGTWRTSRTVSTGDTCPHTCHVSRDCSLQCSWQLQLHQAAPLCWPLLHQVCYLTIILSILSLGTAETPPPCVIYHNISLHNIHECFSCQEAAWRGPHQVPQAGGQLGQRGVLQRRVLLSQAREEPLCRHVPQVVWAGNEPLRRWPIPGRASCWLKVPSSPFYI